MGGKEGEKKILNKKFKKVLWLEHNSRADIK